MRSHKDSDFLLLQVFISNLVFSCHEDCFTDDDFGVADVDVLEESVVKEVDKGGEAANPHAEAGAVYIRLRDFALEKVAPGRKQRRRKSISGATKCTYT